MRIAVVGSRKYPARQVVESEVCSAFMNYLIPIREMFPDQDSNLIYVSGGAYGVDKWSELEVDRLIADGWKIRKEIHLPDWDKYGKSAAYIRNELIIKDADYIMAFWDSESKGTKQGIDLALKLGKCIDIFVRTTKEYERLLSLEGLEVQDVEDDTISNEEQSSL